MLIIRKNMHKVDKFLVLSQDAKNNLISYGKFPDNKIEIVYPASNFKSLISTNPFIRLNIKEPESYIVCVSRWQPHKNVEVLVEGFYKFLSTNSGTDLKLILVGKPVDNYNAPIKKIHQYGLSSKVVIFKDLSDSELSWLYDNGVISVFPSIHEGFGLAVLESLSRGCPAIVDSNTSTREVVGDAGLCVDMRNSSELSATLQIILTDHNQLRSLRGKSKNRADFFSWDKSVSTLLNIYQ
jgi:glycosyltransferase involved in cell wall biosynthesis